MRVGIDVVEIERFKNNALSHIFTENEIEYINKKNIKKYETMAGIFCAKEAFVKALQVGIGNGSILNKIEISHNVSGAPYILKNKFVINKLNEIDLNEIEISISHTKDIAQAICILY